MKSVLLLGMLAAVLAIGYPTLAIAEPLEDIPFMDGMLAVVPATSNISLEEVTTSSRTTSSNHVLTSDYQLSVTPSDNVSTVKEKERMS